MPIASLPILTLQKIAPDVHIIDAENLVGRIRWQMAQAGLFEGGNINRDHRLGVRGRDMMVLDTNLFLQDSGESRLRISEKVAFFRGLRCSEPWKSWKPDRDY